MKECVFCTTPKEEKIYQNKYGYIKKDHFPVTKGHMLIIPHKHVENIWGLSSEELKGLWELVTWAREYNQKNYQVKDFNVGFNDGKNAGQTVFHLHIHVIPRYKGDMGNPRGGVRGVIPSKQKY